MPPSNRHSAQGLALLAAVVFAAAPAASAQAVRATPGQPEARTALELIPARGAAGQARLTVTTPAFANGGRIPFENTQYRTNSFPGLAWSHGPRGTRGYAIIMQDNTLLYRGAPVLHWTMFNIPASVTALPAGMAPDGKPPGSAYGPNYKGAATPYTGPHTPPGPGDDYHFEIFALDSTFAAGAISDFAALTRAMQGHVLASGEVVGHAIADPCAPQAGDVLASRCPVPPPS